MQKTLAIFRKDTRHFWPEILLSLGIAAAFVALTVASVQPTFEDRAGISFPAVATMLLPVSWFLLIARLIHDDTPVGDRQFWLTRPYGWRRLLTAKLLFIVIFVGIPLFLAKLLILHLVQMPVLSQLSWQALSTLNMLATVALVMAALASITANFVRLLLTVLGILLFVALNAYIEFLALKDSSIFNGGAGPSINWTDILFFTVSVAVLVVQYSLRRTALVRTALITIVVLHTAISQVQIRLHHGGPIFIGYNALAAGEAQPMTIAVGPPNITSHWEGDIAYTFTEPTQPNGVPASQLGTSFYVPLHFSGAAPNRTVQLDTLRIHWSSTDATGHIVDSGEVTGTTDPKRPQPDFFNTETIQPGQSKERTLSIQMRADQYARLKDLPLTLTLTAAVHEMQPGRVTPFTIELGRFPVPYNGWCTAYPHVQAMTVTSIDRCQFPLGEPPLALVVFQWTDQPCVVAFGGNSHPLGALGDIGQWVGSESYNAYSGSFTPFAERQLYFETRIQDPNHSTQSDSPSTYLCRGAQGTFTEYHTTRRTLLHLTLPPIVPSHYTLEARDNDALN